MPKLTKVTFDTNIFISRRANRSGPALPANFYMSIVVLQELVVGAEDETEVKLLNAARREYEKAERLLVPTAENWWLAGKVINSLQRGLKSRSRGVTPKISAEEKYRITHDVLIARIARRAGVTIVTDNTKDFERIQSFCNVRFISGKDYFGN
jgi:predicted nucleic acid-binding protein